MKRLKRKVSCILSFLLILGFGLINTDAAVVIDRTTGHTVALFSEPKLMDQAQGTIQSAKLYYNTPVLQMDAEEGVALEAMAAYLYADDTVPDFCFENMNETFTALITDAETAAGFGNTVNEKIIKPQDSGEPYHLTFLEAIGEEVYETYDIFAFAYFCNGTYGDFKVLDHVEQREKNRFFFTGMNAFEKFTKGDRGYQIQCFGSLSLFVGYVPIEKGLIEDKAAETEMIVFMLDDPDYDKSDLYYNIPWEEIFDNEQLERETPVPDKTELPVFNTGDVDQNLVIDADDALLILKYSAKISALSKAQLDVADVNQDGNVNAEDALFILKYAAKLTI